MKSKNKLVPRLLGITKESVMRVDEKTKDVVQEWPLTTVKRWAASPKSFTLVLTQHTCSYRHTLISRWFKWLRGYRKCFFIFINSIQLKSLGYVISVKRFLKTLKLT